MKLGILSTIQKLKVALAFQKHQSAGHQNFVDKDTSKTNFDRCNFISHHKMLFYHQKPSVQTRDYHRSSSILAKLLSVFF